MALAPLSCPSLPGPHQEHSLAPGGGVSVHLRGWVVLALLCTKAPVLLGATERAVGLVQCNRQCQFLREPICLCITWMTSQCQAAEMRPCYPSVSADFLVSLSWSFAPWQCSMTSKEKATSSFFCPGFTVNRAWLNLGLQHLSDVCIIFFPFENCNITLPGMSLAVVRPSDSCISLRAHPE